MHFLVSFLLGIALFHLSRLFPVLSALLFVLSCFLASRFVFRDGKGASPQPDPGPPATAGPLGIGGRPASRQRKAATAVFLIILVAGGYLYARARFVPAVSLSPLSGTELLIEGTTEGPPRLSSSGNFVTRVKVVSAVDRRTGEVLDGLRSREIALISDEALEKDMHYTVAVKVGQDVERRNPGASGQQMLLAHLQTVQKSEHRERNAFSRWLGKRRDDLTQYLLGHFTGESGPLIASLTTGVRSSLSDGTKEAFNRSGLAHLLSISGTHFGLFSVLVFGIFRFCLTRLPYAYLQRLTIYLTPSQASAILSLPFMLLYLLISSAEIPAIRSFIMITIFLFGLFLGRKDFWLNALVFAAFLICAWDPSALLDLSFQLSFLAVLAIGIVAGRSDEEAAAECGGGRIKNSLKKSVFVSLAATLGTAPLVALSFHYFSVISPLANLIVTPFVGFALVPLSLIAACVFIFSGYYPFGSVIALLADTSLRGVHGFAAVPGAAVPVAAFPMAAAVFFYGGCILALLGRKRYALIPLVLAFSIVLVPAVQAGRGMSVVFLDVGQGEAAVIETENGTVVVLDTGATGREVESYLKYRGKRDVGAVLVSHADEDHAGGVMRILERFVTGELWDNGLLLYRENPGVNVTHRSLERGDEIVLDGLRFLVLHPYKGFYTAEGGEAAGGNNDSLVVKIAGRRSFLFTGDVSREAEEDMIHLGPWLRSDVIKVAHHGSPASTTDEFLRTVSPKLGVISAGRFNRYGHPHRDVLERLKGLTIYRTDLDGAIKMTETEEGLSVKTFREFAFEDPQDLAGEWRNIRRLFERW